MVKTCSVDQVPFGYCCVLQQIRTDIWAKQLTQLARVKKVLSNCGTLTHWVIAKYISTHRPLWWNECI